MIYRRSVGDLLPGYLKCTNYHTLCPACRVFGWVNKNPSEEDRNVTYASRVHISNGIPKEGSQIEVFDEPVTLAILSSPKPTTTLFYLLDGKGKPADIDYDDSSARLRGHKIYRHHGKWEDWSTSQKEEFKRPGGIKDDQNRTIKGLVKPKAKFCFTIEFRNLTEIELGALLWALELEDGMFHRLGFAKPLGFGSVEIKIVHMDIMDMRNRYASFQPKNKGWKRVAYQGWIKKFKVSLSQIYDYPSFERLPNIEDLQTLLSIPDIKTIHYPRSEDNAMKGENFKWFVGNKSRLMDARKPKHKRKLPDPQLLPLPGDDNGFTRMDEKGFAP